MERLVNTPQTVSSSSINNINSGTHLVIPSSAISADHISTNNIAYVTINYATDMSNDALDTNMDSNYLNYYSPSYTDLVYIDSSGYIHEVGNSEILFDAFFDYIIRGNEFQNSLVKR